MKNILLLLFVITGYVFAQVEIDLSKFPSPKKSKSKSSRNYAKVTKSGNSLGNYVWFDHNQNGLQDYGEQGLANVTINLYNNSNCAGEILKTTNTDVIGSYVFNGLLNSASKYCIEVIYPDGWTKTLSNIGDDTLNSDLVEGTSSSGYIKNITIENNLKLDAGLYHVSTNCQGIDLEEGTEGKYDNSVGWAKPYTLDVKFKGLVAHGYCHEYTNSGPKNGEKYTLHLNDRLGFSSQKKENLSRVFSYMSDREVIELVNKTAESENSIIWFNIITRTFVWYYSDWNRDFSKIEMYVDDFDSWSSTEKTEFKKICRLIINRVEGINGENKYPAVKVYYLWNETNDGHQDLIVPETSFIPDIGECMVPVKPQPLINIETSTNGIDADSPTGPTISFGGAVTWRYVVTNNGNVALTNVKVKDNKVGTICTIGTLGAGESKTCTKVTTAVTGQYSNIGTVTASFDGKEISATDASHYLGGDKPTPAIDIETATNNHDADNPTGPSIAFDGDVTWTYVVKNTGNVALKDIVVTDSKLKKICTIGNLAVGASKTCTKTGKAIEGQYENIGTVTGKYGNKTVTDTDKSHYKGGAKANPAIDIETATNNHDADNPTGPSIVFDGDVTWTYVVKNTGNVALKNIVVTDSKLNQICTIGNLAVGASKTCTKTGKAVEGQYENIGTVTGKYGNKAVTDTDKSHYKGGEKPAPAINIEKSTNGEDADTQAKAVPIEVGKKLTWKYIVKNTGNVKLTDVVVSDNKIGIICKVKSLEVAKTKTCTKTGVATEGPYENIGKVVAQYDGKAIDDSDKSHYVGAKKPNSNVNVGDYVWWDKNANGIQDNGEDGIDNVEVKLLDENANPIESVKTDATGHYLFTDVLAGKYQIQFLFPNGFTLASPQSKGGDIQKDSDGSATGLTELFTVDLTDRLDIDMGFVKGTAPKANNDSKTGERCTVVVQDVVNNDSDSEDDLNTSTVNFVIPEGATGTDTDNDGDIDTLVVPEEGTWRVDNEGKVTYTPNNECTGKNPTSIKYSVTDQTENISNKATISVVYPDLDKAQLGDKVWFDADKNGKQNDGESGLEGITVELYDANGDLNGTTVTDENGTYSFVDLEAGEYSVKFISKDGWSITKQDVNGVDESEDSDADAKTGITKSISLNDGDKNMDIDAGMYLTEKPSIKVIKTTNGVKNATLVEGDVVKWRYVISNTGNTVLTNLLLKDDKEGEISNCTGDGSLERLNPTKSITCEKLGTASLGAYKNIATITAIDPEDKVIKDTDSSSYVGQDAPILLGSIGDYVWLDSNKDGIQSAQELPLSSIKVMLFDKENKLVKETTTDASGQYTFGDIISGNYHIEFVVPNGYSVTSKLKGNDRAIDSDADRKGKTEIFMLSANQNLTGIDMGLYPATVNVGNRVWYDANKNGIQDPEEKENNIPNIGVKLYKEGGELVAETKTRSTGYYHFVDLLAGKYYIVFDVPNTYKVTPQKQGSNRSNDSDAHVETGKTDIFTLVAGIDNLTIDMGLYQEAAKVGDRVWYDANKNGIQDATENGVGEVEVKLYSVDKNNLVAVTKTSANGIYLFDNVVPGEYYIVFKSPAAYTITDSGKGTDTTDSDADESGRTANFTLLAGTKNSTIDMGVYQNVVSLGDRVWLDTNHDGIQDIGEVGVRDVNVTIHSEINDFSKSVLTDENGNYLFTHLSAGEYFVEFSAVPYGYLITQKDVNANENDLNDSDVFVNADEKFVTEGTLLTPGENDFSWDMGIYKTVCLPGKAVLGNFVWEDFNKNGIQEIGERGVPNVKATLFNNDTDEKVAEVTTDENGFYEFAHIDPEFNYYVQFTVPAGYVVSPQDQDDDVIDSDTDENGKSEVISVMADKINSTVDMGIYTEGSTIGDKVWYDEKDAQSNGIQDVGEQGVYNLKVTLYNSNGDEVQTTRTNASGEYHFTNVAKGTYSIGFSELPDGYIFTKAGEGADSETDSDVKMNGRTNSIYIDGMNNITSIDAGIRKVNIGSSSDDIKRGTTGQNVIIDVLANDAEGTYRLDPKSVKITSIPEGALLSDDGKTLTVPGEGVWSVDSVTGAITFTPEDGFIGDPTAISYGVEDVEGNEITAEVSVNYPPVANDDYVNGEVSKQIVVHVTDNDSNTSSPLDKASLRIIDPSNGNEVEILVVNGEGTWSTNSDGTITFTPEDGFINNPTPIEYTIKEQEGDVSNRATVTIVYPDAVDDTIVIPTDHEGVITINVTTNDSNNSDSTTVTLGCTQPGSDTITVKGEGVWSVGENGNIMFTPEAGFKGEPTDIKYTVGLLVGGRSNCANVDIRYELLARDDRSTLNVGGVTIINILSNDFGAINPESVKLMVPVDAPKGTILSEDGKTLTVPGEGVWSVDHNGVVRFSAEDGFTLIPTPIKYSVENNEGTQSNEATITLVQGGVMLVIHDDIAVANGSSPIVIDILSNDIGDTKGSTVLLVAGDGSLSREVLIEGEGRWSVDSDNRVTFTPLDGYTGTPTPIEYVVRDINGNLSNRATIRISGTCTCETYDESVPAMSFMSALLMVLFTLFLSIFLLRKEERILESKKN